mmetsp:Transcript_8066/g.12334  ORF Transcript_8066/g.12334 Transcript_8066/m.12334 type:complete len:294 (-) Transcript_8066:21-902(-)
MKLTLFAITTAIPFLSAQEENSTSDDSSSYKLIGNGACWNTDRSPYDVVGFDNVETLEQCGEACNVAEVRGFQYDENNNRCECLLDDGYSKKTLPKRLVSNTILQGQYEFSNENDASGSIKSSSSSNESSSALKCYSNTNFQSPYTKIGDGSCRNEEGQRYNSLVFSNVATPELCGSPAYCGIRRNDSEDERHHFAGFDITDMNYCICYLDNGQDIPSSILERDDYNPYHTKLDTSNKESLGPITKSDQQHGSMLYLCYSYNSGHDDDDATSDDEPITTTLSSGLRGSASSVE